MKTSKATFTKSKPIEPLNGEKRGPVKRSYKNELRLMRWANDGYPPIDLSNELYAILELIKEVRRLRNCNKNEFELMAHKGIIDLAERLISEANFIGLIDNDLKDDYLNMASFSKTNFEFMRDIFRKEKRRLTMEFDDHQRNGSLNQLKESDFNKYRTLYRAKYLKDPVDSEANPIEK